MTALSRNKGAAFERKVAQELFTRLGVSLSRDLRQYQKADHGDLVTDDPTWPFLIECKHQSKAALLAWRAQAAKAAAGTPLTPVVIYRITGGPIRVSAPLSVFEGPADEWCDLTLDGFAWVAREMMAERAGVSAVTQLPVRGRINDV